MTKPKRFSISNAFPAGKYVGDTEKSCLLRLVYALSMFLESWWEFCMRKCKVLKDFWRNVDISFKSFKLRIYTTRKNSWFTQAFVVVIITEKVTFEDHFQLDSEPFKALPSPSHVGHRYQRNISKNLSENGKAWKLLNFGETIIYSIFFNSLCIWLLAGIFDHRQCASFTVSARI